MNIENLLNNKPNIFSENDSFHKALFGDKKTNRGAFLNELNDYENFLKSLVGERDVYNYPSDVFKYIFYLLFKGFNIFNSDSDTLKIVMKMIMSRNGNKKRVTKNAILGSLKYIYKSVYIIEGGKNIVAGDGMFTAEATGWIYDKKLIEISSEMSYSNGYSAKFLSVEKQLNRQDGLITKAFDFEDKVDDPNYYGVINNTIASIKEEDEPRVNFRKDESLLFDDEQNIDIDSISDKFLGYKKAMSSSGDFGGQAVLQYNFNTSELLYNFYNITFFLFIEDEIFANILEIQVIEIDNNDDEKCIFSRQIKNSKTNQWEQLNLLIKMKDKTFAKSTCVRFIQLKKVDFYLDIINIREVARPHFTIYCQEQNIDFDPHSIVFSCLDNEKGNGDILPIYINKKIFSFSLDDFYKTENETDIFVKIESLKDADFINIKWSISLGNKLVDIEIRDLTTLIDNMKSAGVTFDFKVNS